jgi:hypothetical protein
MSQGNSSSFGKEVLSASQKLSSPTGQNLTNATTRTLSPSMGAIAYGSDTNLLYYGSVDTWNVAGMTGSTGLGATGMTGLGATGMTGRGATGMTGLGATGMTGLGATGNTGQQGVIGNTGMTGQQGSTGLSGQPTPTTDHGSLTWYLNQADGTVTIASGGTVPWTTSQVGGTVTASLVTGLKAVTAGTYMINFMYANFLPSGTNIRPQSMSLVVNAGAGTAQYTLQEIQDPTPSPAIYFNSAGQSAVIIITLAANDEVNLKNTLAGGNSADFKNDVSPYSIGGTLGAIAALLTMVRIA